MDFLLRCLAECAAAFIGTAAFALLFSVPKKYYFFGGGIGAAGWLTYRLLGLVCGRIIAVFLGTVAVILLSRLLAVREKCPVTEFMVPGLFPLVPGAGIYWTMYELVMENPSAASQRGFESFQDVIAIVLGIIVVFELPQKLFHFAGRKKE